MTYSNFNLLQKALVEHLSIINFFKSLIYGLPISEQAQKVIFTKLLSFSWEEHINTSKTYLQNALNSLERIISLESKELPPPESLKGVYLCLGDDARSLTIAGSLYFNEEDWAANADFYSDDYELSDLIINLREQLDNVVGEIVEEKYIEYLIFSYLAYLCYTFSPSLHLSKVLKSSGIAIGYSDGNEINIGSFSNGTFVANLVDVDTVGHSNPSSVAEPAKFEFASRGPLWEYLLWNYKDVISKAGLSDQFYKGGEEGAEQIALSLQNKIYINSCQKCSHIKKTPHARLCLGCGDFMEG